MTHSIPTHNPETEARSKTTNEADLARAAEEAFNNFFGTRNERLSENGDTDPKISNSIDAQVDELALRQSPPVQSTQFSSFLHMLSSLERLSNIRCQLRQTKDTNFNYTIIEDVIMDKIMELHSLITDHDYSNMMEDEMLGEIERIVEIRKLLINTQYPIAKTLDRLGEMINDLVGYLK